MYQINALNPKDEGHQARKRFGQNFLHDQRVIAKIVRSVNPCTGENIVEIALFKDGHPFRVVGNLPYNISTPLLFHLLEFGDKVKDMHFMLQKEVVDRITAVPNTKEYGRLSVMIQYYCKPTFLFEVPPGSFNPPPKVTSAVFRLEPYAIKPIVAKDEKALARLVGHVFTQRRKTLRNSLKGMLAEDGFEKAGVDPMARPETLSLADFVALSDQMVS